MNDLKFLLNYARVRTGLRIVNTSSHLEGPVSFVTSHASNLRSFYRRHFRSISYLRFLNAVIGTTSWILREIIKGFKA